MKTKDVYPSIVVWGLTFSGATRLAHHQSGRNNVPCRSGYKHIKTSICVIVCVFHLRDSTPEFLKIMKLKASTLSEIGFLMTCTSKPLLTCANVLHIKA